MGAMRRHHPRPVTHTHPDGHSDVTRDQVSKKKEQKALFFFGWGGLEQNKV
jgi:hypothetical protein